MKLKNVNALFHVMNNDCFLTENEFQNNQEVPIFSVKLLVEDVEHLIFREK